MESLDRAAFDRILAAHGAAPPEWGVAIPVPGDPAFPALLLPPEIFRHLPAMRLAVRSVDGNPILFAALGTSSANPGPELKPVGLDSPPCGVLLVCDARWRPLWRAALERGRFGVAERGAASVRSCEIDEPTRSVISAFVGAAEREKSGQLQRLAIERKQISGRLAGKEHPDAVAELRALEERWARLILGLAVDGSLHDQVQERLPVVGAEAAHDALAHLKAAEEWQWEIGTWSTSGGEGIASMVEVYTLKLAQAWLALAVGDSAGARALAEAVAADPNNLGGEFFKKTIADLRRRLRT